MDKDVSIIIVNYNTKSLLSSCIDSIFANVKSVSFEIIVVDNASIDGSSDMIKSYHPEVILIENDANIGFGAANNMGAEMASGSYIFLLNSDAILCMDTVFGLYRYLEENSEYGMAGPGVLLTNGEKQPKICGDFPSLLKIINDSILLSQIFPRIEFFRGIYTDNLVKMETSLDWISGVCMLIRVDVFKSVGGFDESIFLYCEDIDLCKRVQNNGWKIMHIENYQIIHKCGGSAKTNRDIIRNSTLQQKYFLKMLKNYFSPFQIQVIYFILFIGLIIRMVLGVLIKVILPEKKSLLFETSIAKMKSLKCE